MERFIIRGGECAFSDDAILIETDWRTFLKQIANQRPLLLGVLALTFLASLLSGAGTLITLLLLEQPPDFLFAVSWQTAVVSSAIFAGILFIWAMWWWLVVRRSQRKEGHPENVSTEEAIPYDSIKSVQISEISDIPVMFIQYRQHGTTVTRPIYFQRNAEAQIEKARTTFRSLDIPIETDSVEV